MRHTAAALAAVLITFSAGCRETSGPALSQANRLPLGAATPEAPVCQGEICQRKVNVACPRVDDTFATLRVSGPGTAGTIVLTVGGPGPGFYRDRGNDPNLQAFELDSRYHSDMMDELLQLGFRLVEVSWTGSSAWNQSVSLQKTPDNQNPVPAAGAITLACRPATVIDFVHREYLDQGLFIAQGNSSGNSQIAFSLLYYGLGDILDVVNLGAGPPPCPIHWTVTDPQGNPSRRTNGEEQETHCMVQRGAGEWDATREPLLSGEPELELPDTRVNVFIGALEPNTPILEISPVFYEAITADKSYTVVPNTYHGSYLTLEGTEALMDAVLTAMAQSGL